MAYGAPGNRCGRAVKLVPHGSPDGMMARLFALTVLVYPLALALLCLGAGLLVDRCSGRFLPAALLPSVGAATLIALSQLSTYLSALATATPYLIAACAVAGFVLGQERVRALAGQLRTRGGAGEVGYGHRDDEDRASRLPLCALLAVPLLAYLLALAPVLLSGRASFSSFMALSDSAVHMIGADFLIHHGQDYSHLSMQSSYGQFIAHYYATGYPSGADTLFGGSTLLLGLPLIWTFQPFNAVMLALASGPAWVLARRLGLRRSLAALAALSASVPALVYGYALIGSVKEIVALTMMLTLGALVVVHRRWLTRAPIRALPIAIVLAAGVSALGAGFGAWGLAAAVVLLAVLIGARAQSASRAPRGDLRRTVAMLLVLAVALAVAAWPTWAHFSQSLDVAQNIASTGNAGNLPAPLKWTQAFGIWLHTSYKQAPSGAALALTDVLVGLAMLACLTGGFALLRARRYALAGWIATTLLAWLVLDRSATTWVDAKALVLTSPVIVLLAWGGIGALLSASLVRRLGATLLAVALLGGVLASDAAQYHASNLAPTARYEELASINRRFAGKGPALFTDFDEYSMYVLRDLGAAGPDFVYVPPALAGLAGGYGQPVELERASAAALRAYPLIVTRRDPSAEPPPAAYALAWQGDYYDVWSRPAGSAPAFARLHATSAQPLSCTRVKRIVRRLADGGGRAVGLLAPEIVHVRLRPGAHPPGWGREHQGFAMRRAGSLSRSFSLPRAGSWELWLQGQFMPTVGVAVDGRAVASIAGQLAGNSLVPDTARPIALRLAAGRHRLTIARASFSLAPGSGGSAVLDAAFLTPAGAPARALRTLAGASASRSPCASRYQSIELLAGGRSIGG
jgi:hypothetical protein